MSATYQSEAHHSPDVRGTRLFGDLPLSDFLTRHAELERWPSLRRALSTRGKLSRLTVRRCLMDGMLFASPIALDAKREVDVSIRQRWLTARASIPFKGDFRLFSCRPAERDGRTLKATIAGNILTLTVRCWDEDELMLLPTLYSELRAIEKGLARQSIEIAEHNRALSEAIRCDVDDNFDDISAMRRPVTKQQRIDNDRLRTELLRRFELLQSDDDAAIFREFLAHGFNEGLSRWREDDTPASWLARVGAK